MIKKILEADRRLRIAHLSLKKNESYDPELNETIAVFFNEYANEYNLTVDEVLASYNKFTLQYLNDLNNFQKTNEYPILKKGEVKIDRIDYDIALILSSFFEKVRHAIFKEIKDSFKNINTTSKILFIGIGPGIELTLLPNNNRDIDAYDLAISDFTKNKFSNFNFVEEIFVECPNSYSHIYCIELLEHIQNPELLMKNIYNSLIENGEVYLTTASNMPQFDHIINFHDRPFDNSLEEMGFEIIKKVNFTHNYNGQNSESYNTWYRCKK